MKFRELSCCSLWTCTFQKLKVFSENLGASEGLTSSCENKRSEKQRRKGKIKHPNAEFQRIARRDKKAFLSNQCREIEENNRMGKTRDLFKKIRDNKGTFHAKMGLIEDRNGMDLTEQKILRRGGKNTQKN